MQVVGKPEASFFQLALEDTHVTPQAAVVSGDFETYCYQGTELCIAHVLYTACSTSVMTCERACYKDPLAAHALTYVTFGTVPVTEPVTVCRHSGRYLLRNQQ